MSIGHFAEVLDINQFLPLREIVNTVTIMQNKLVQELTTVILFNSMIIFYKSTDLH